MSDEASTTVIIKHRADIRQQKTRHFLGRTRPRRLSHAGITKADNKVATRTDTHDDSSSSFLALGTSLLLGWLEGQQVIRRQIDLAKVLAALAAAPFAPRPLCSLAADRDRATLTGGLDHRQLPAAEDNLHVVALEVGQEQAGPQDRDIQSGVGLSDHLQLAQRSGQLPPPLLEAAGVAHRDADQAGRDAGTVLGVKGHLGGG